VAAGVAVSLAEAEVLEAHSLGWLAAPRAGGTLVAAAAEKVAAGMAEVGRVV